MRRRLIRLLAVGAIVALLSLAAPGRPASWPLSGETVVAADASPTPADAGDPRSGQEAGFVGHPLLAIGGVVAIGVGALVLTLLYVRLTDPRRS